MSSTTFGALVLFTARLAETVGFYRALGFPLEKEQHEPDEPVHFACEMGAVHFAIYEASAGDAPGIREGGSAILGWSVPSLAAAEEELRRIGARIHIGPEDRPWGKRMLALDPDGRTVELYQSR